MYIYMYIVIFRCDLFDVHLKIAVEHANRLGLSSAWVATNPVEFGSWR